MRSNYKKLGQYIRQVNIRNTELEVDRLLGVSVKKIFIPSIANTVGTNFKSYKIVVKNQFVYIADTSRRGDKIGLAMLEDYDIAIVSQAYTVFEIKDSSKLLPEYLMMWFRRPEFDRYARYKSHGSVREIFDWEEMCDIELPVPSIEKQREIVAEYNTVVDRIKLNEELNKKLEETAQTLYKHWFVDFEFPDENGNPYKTTGGEMVYNSELEKEIPKGWESGEIGSVVETLGGGTPSTTMKKYWEDGNINWYSPTDITKSTSIFCKGSVKKINNIGLKNSSARLFAAFSIMMTSRATIGKVGINISEAATNQGFITLIPNNKYPLYFLIGWLNTNLEAIDGLSSGSTFREISKSDFRELKIFLEQDLFILYNKITEKIFSSIKNNSFLSHQLEDLKDLILSRMTKV